MNLRLWRHYQKNQAILKTQVTKIKTQVTKIKTQITKIKTQVTKIKLVIVIMIKDTSYPLTLIVN